MWAEIREKGKAAPDVVAGGQAMRRLFRGNEGEIRGIFAVSG
jgi:hypothetical protein